jgi:hypothetical protein
MLGVLTAVVTPPTPPSLLNSYGSKTVQKGQCQTVTSISGGMTHLSRQWRSMATRPEGSQPQFRQAASPAVESTPPDHPALWMGRRCSGTPESRAVRLERDGWILLVAGSPRPATELLRAKSADLQNAEFRAVYLAYDQSFDWDPTDPRLEELANTVVSFVEHRPPKPVVEPTPKSEQDETAVAIALLSSDTGNSSPAWDRLTELCKVKLEDRPS